jgi:N-acetylmuramic acid 6-phosphate etherase
MDHLQTESRNPASMNLDELTPLEIVQLMNAEDDRVIPAVAAQAEAIAQAITVIADRLRNGGRLIYAGAGTSGRLGVLDATECPPTFNSPPSQVVGIIAGGPKALTRAVEGAEDHPEYAACDLEALKLGPQDVLVGIATSGRTPYVLGAAAYAKTIGAYAIGLACNPDADLNAVVDLAITPVVGPEVLSGSTRLKAGTATKLVLNMLTTGAMVRLGKTFGNLMVDLRAANSKLRRPGAVWLLRAATFARPWRAQGRRLRGLRRMRDCFSGSTGAERIRLLCWLSSQGHEDSLGWLWVAGKRGRRTFMRWGRLRRSRRWTKQSIGRRQAADAGR